MFLRSPKPSGLLHLGMIVTLSTFHGLGQIKVEATSLKMSDNGMARKSENFVTSSGTRSPPTLDFGFLKCFSLEANSCGSMWGRRLGVITGIWSGVRGSNSADILLKKTARSSAVSVVR